MELFGNGTLILLPIAYTLLVVAYAHRFLGFESWFARSSRIWLVATVLTHISALIVRGITVGSCPIATPWEATSVVAFSVALIYWIVELRTNDSTTGVFVLAIAALLEILATIFVAGGDTAAGDRLGAFASVHGFAALFGLSAVSVAGAYGLLYLFLYTAIKRGWYGTFYRRVAPLDRLGDLNYWAALVAFVALTLTAGLGYWGSSSDPESPAAFADAGVLLGTSLWLLYAITVLGRRWLRLGGKRLAYCTLLGLPVAVAIGVSGLLQRGGFHG
ncbi:MAG: hypothetical protein AAF581_11915 [Planctomycetota bacterium]